MIGMGTVGLEVARRLIASWELLTARAGATPVLRRVAVRDLSKPRDVDLKNVHLGEDPAAVVDDAGVDVVVEVMGGVDAALSLIERALRAGKSVVTANKAVVAEHGVRLWSLAHEYRAGFWFEASVGGGLPIVSTLRDSLRADRISALDAVINGTTNIMLTRMRRDGVTLATALEDAQRRGFAEADPTADIDGWDASQKLVIMSRLAFGLDAAVDDVDRAGIRDLDRIDLGYAGQLGYAVRLLAHGHVTGGNGLHLRVRPTAVPLGHRLHAVDDADNAVIISSDLASTVIVEGLGGGGASTASAIVSDIVNAVRRRGAQPAPPTLEPSSRLGADEVEVSMYVRLRVADVADAQALVIQALEDRGVPVADAIAKPPIDGPDPQLVLLTGAAARAVHDAALETLDSLPVVREVACAMDRIEEMQ